MTFRYMFIPDPWPTSVFWAQFGHNPSVTELSAYRCDETRAAIRPKYF